MFCYIKQPAPIATRFLQKILYVSHVAVPFISYPYIFYIDFHFLIVTRYPFCSTELAVVSCFSKWCSSSISCQDEFVKQYNITSCCNSINVQCSWCFLNFFPTIMCCDQISNLLHINIFCRKIRTRKRIKNTMHLNCSKCATSVRKKATHLLYNQLL